MTTIEQDKTAALGRDVLKAFDDVNGGVHPGFRPAHAKGLLVSGAFTPSASAAALTRAPHVLRQSTPVWVRFSDFAGVPGIPDNGPEASPRGMAIRFYLAEHVHTDIIAHSVDGFPTRTAEEFLEFLRAIHASAPGTPKPTPLESFLGQHPSALEFVEAAAKSIPSSFLSQSFFAVNAYKFVDGNGLSRYGRYRIYPAGGVEELDAKTAANKEPDYLFNDLKQRLSAGKPAMRIVVQVAEPGDVVDDATIHWPAGREEIEFGVVELSGVVANNDDEQRHIIFDPIPRVDGIESSDDPLLEPRATVYLMSGRRRRANGKA